MTEAGVYMIVMSYKFLMHFCAKVYVLDYHSMQRSMREDFLFICTRGEKYSLITQFARVHKKLLMFEQTITAPVVCLSAYAASVKLDEGEVHAILIILLFASIAMLFLPSCMCTILTVQVNSISYACWNMPFWNASPVIRPYLLLIMQKSLRPLPLKVPGFQEFSVQTFSNKLSSAYSYFHMLRQANKK
ncbi:uncharacterized protein LOC120626575 [Pararge aegeria]|uniref:uncharacterized protein LOC120626575 n=1 Tax=Pararge aegeria TaxID=116150 RepID=UPI0019D16801|nr:uncharacterized protein LOC120626575 [Pararge aegeria]